MIRIGITLGDINGIGPEVAIKAAQQRWPKDVEIVLVGSMHGLRRRAGKIDPAASLAAAEWIEAATRACLGGYLSAIVTAPISKEGFHRAGIDVPGHTEFLAALTRTKRYAMMLFGGSLRVSLVTRHVPLASVPALLTKRNILETIRITSEALPWMGSRRSRIAVCGLNPHAGEGGELGREEIRIIAPAVRAARRARLNVVGPVPADTIFHQAARGDYDAVVAMYHDQGLAPLKLHAFDTGVNVTLGLPIVRTSPDHGTAFDIAGKSRAEPSSMIAAVKAAIDLARRKNPWSM
jgi:4-hydroxythreonine-4-phosphate dehydrogenase